MEVHSLIKTLVLTTNVQYPIAFMAAIHAENSKHPNKLTAAIQYISANFPEVFL